MQRMFLTVLFGAFVFASLELTFQENEATAQTGVCNTDEFPPGGDTFCQSASIPVICPDDCTLTQPRQFGHTFSGNLSNGTTPGTHRWTSFRWVDCDQIIYCYQTSYGDFRCGGSSCTPSPNSSCNNNYTVYQAWAQAGFYTFVSC